MNNTNNQTNLTKSSASGVLCKWCWPGHAAMIKVIYNALPDKLKRNLDLDAMIDGSNDPDEKFRDTAMHNYPKSYKKAVEWIDQGKLNYETGNYKRASYCFGIASHYITDTFAAPHCVSKESGKDHHNFEIINDDYTPTIQVVTGDLDTLMQKGVEQGKEDWKNWKITKDPSIAHSEADMGASVTYEIIKSILSLN